MMMPSSAANVTLARLRSTPAPSLQGDSGAGGGASSGLAVRKKLWRFIDEKSWYNQPLRMMGFWLYQYIWGYQGPAGGGPPIRGSPSRQPGMNDEWAAFDGLEDVYMEILNFRRKGKAVHTNGDDGG